MLSVVGRGAGDLAEIVELQMEGPEPGPATFQWACLTRSDRRSMSVRLA
jgi:hypothetical protein